MIQKAKNKKSVVIIGGGIAGLSCGIRLKQSGWDVIVLERSGLDRGIGHGFIVQENGINSLKVIGVDLRSYKKGKEIGEFNLLDSKGNFVHSSILNSIMGFRRSDFINILESSIPPGVVRFQHEVKNIKIGEIGIIESIILSNGIELKADLFIAADGINSRLRKLIFPEANLNPVLVKEIVCHSTDRELAELIGNKFIKFQCSSGGQSIGVVPVGSDNLVWFAQFFTKKLDIKDSDVLGFLRSNYSDWPDLVKKLLKTANIKKAHVWNTTDLDPLTKLSHKNLVFVGDAAHVFLPFTSQGVNSAIKDAEILGDSLDLFPHIDDLKSALSSYEDSRIPEIKRIFIDGRNLRDRFIHPELFSDKIPPLAK